MTKEEKAELFKICKELTNDCLERAKKDIYTEDTKELDIASQIVKLVSKSTEDK